VPFSDEAHVTPEELSDAVAQLELTTMRLSSSQKAALNSEFGDLDVGSLDVSDL
jgi:hypothetical protein